MTHKLLQIWVGVHAGIHGSLLDHTKLYNMRITITEVHTDTQ
jgi:hypothetical protein